MDREEPPLNAGCTPHTTAPLAPAAVLYCSLKARFPTTDSETLESRRYCRLTCWATFRLDIYLQRKRESKELKNTQSWKASDLIVHQMSLRFFSRRTLGHGQQFCRVASQPALPRYLLQGFNSEQNNSVFLLDHKSLITSGSHTCFCAFF